MMRLSLHSLWRASVLLCLLLQCGDARVQTEAQAGPLYRVVDAPLSISCNVSGFSNEDAVKDFKFYVTKPADPTFEINIISTKDPDFGYAIYQSRVWSKDISITRVSPNAVIFEIQRLQKGDEGEYDCSVENSELLYDGTYSVKTAVKVIDNSLSVSSPASTSLSFNEGEALTLTCQASSNTSQHTHLSFAWFLHKDGEDHAQPIISLNRDFTLRPGQGFDERYRAGLISLDKVGEATYRLKMSQLVPSDRGKIHCQAQEWIQDPDQSWYPIAQKDAGEITLEVKARESGLTVKMQDTDSVAEGQRLRLACEVDGVKGQLSVTWQHKSSSTPAALFTNVISLSQEGVVEGTEEFRSRKVRATRPAPNIFIFELDEVKPSDSGVYQCAVSEWKTNSKTHSQTQGATIKVTPLDMRVVLISRNNKATVGDNVDLMCRIRGPDMPITLTWNLQRDVNTLDNILTVCFDGSISWSLYQQYYQVKVEKKNNEVIHYLQIISASHREAGMYLCHVSVFMDNIHKKLPQSNAVAVEVQNPGTTDIYAVAESNLALSSPPTMTANINMDINIACSVTAKSSQSSLYAVTWLLKQDGNNKVIVSSDRNAMVTFGPQLEKSQQKRISMIRTNGPRFELTIRQATTADGGTYICMVEEWLQDPRGDWYQLSTVFQESTLTVVEPANDFRLKKTEQMLFAKEGSEVELKCDIGSGTSGASFFHKVTWLHTVRGSPTRNASLVELDHTGLLNYPEDRVVRGLQERLHLSRPTQSSFPMRIQRAQVEDSGTFWCKVEQYQLGHDGRWWQKASDSVGPIHLTVNVTEPDLVLVKKEEKLNVSLSQSFTIPCHITSQSSNESRFQVTWFWQNESETKHSIFTVHQNSTLHDHFGGGNLRFVHPVPNQFSITVFNPRPESSGLYYCEVEEWLPSLSHGWRKTAVERSGGWNVTVYGKGHAVAASESACNSLVWIAIIVIILIILMLVIILLIVKICKSKTPGGKKKGQSFWTEQHPLKPGVEN